MNMLINRYAGGLGNQMFQYVFGLNLKQNGKYVIADTAWYDREISCGIMFSLEQVFPSVLLNRDVEKVEQLEQSLNSRWIGTRILNRLFPDTRKIYIERKEFQYDEGAFQTKKVGVSGCWQCYKYVDNVSEKVREDFTFAGSYPLEAQIMLKNIENSNAVFLHVRGGDYNSELYARKLFGNICTAEYYNSAISVMKKKLSNPVFWVFTNDKKYAKSILANVENIYFVSDYVSGLYEDWIDLLMMSKCNHAIIANSSFSWWGAWLIENKDKVIIAPKKWTNKKKNFDICDPHWIKI